MSIVIVLLFIALVVYFSATYIDDTVTEDKGYGFSIGEDKLTAFTYITNKNVSNTVDVVYAIQVGEKPQNFSVVNIQQDTFHHINNFNTWNLLLNKERNFLNTIRLTFKENELIEIYRHKQWLELP